MTQTIVIGPKVSCPPKPVEFVLTMAKDGMIWKTPSSRPSDFRFVELICQDYQPDAEEGRDLMFAYNYPDKRYRGILYLGNWNSGIV